MNIKKILQADISLQDFFILHRDEWVPGYAAPEMKENVYQEYWKND